MSYRRMAKQQRNIPNEAKSYWSFREELSIINEIVFKGERLVIPEVMRKKVFDQMESKSNNFLATSQSAN